MFTPTLRADAAPPPDEKPSTTWFTDAGFGIFLHWGAYSTAAGRWNGLERTRDLWGEWLLNRANISRPDYEALARKFSPTKFDAAEWAQVFKDAGARYVVLTAKHHEGFAMFHSQVTKYNVVDWPTDFHRDVVKELGDAVRTSGLKFGVYYSQEIDWHNRGKTVSYDDYFNNLCMPQVSELLSNYGPIAIMWFDIGLHDAEKVKQLKALVRKLAPQTLISPRIGGNGGDYQGGGDNEVPATIKRGPWESCMTLNYHWATYPQDVYQHSAMDVIRLLADIRSKGGNLLLDVGPQADGSLAPRDVVVLRQVGQWLGTFGASIYGVSASPVAPVPWGRVTAGQNNTLYLHVFDVPASGAIILPGVAGNIASAWLLGNSQRKPLHVTTVGNDHRIDLDIDHAPIEALNADDMVIAVQLAPGATFDTALLAENDFPNEFHPSSAKLAGGAKYQHQHLNWIDAQDPAVEKARYDEIGSLASAASSLQWQFRTAEPGDFHIVVDYSEDNSTPGQLTAQIDNDIFRIPLRPTPETSYSVITTTKHANTNFTSIRLGTVSLPTSGNHVMTVSAQPASPDAVPLVINKITLVPTRTTPLERSVGSDGKPLPTSMPETTDGGRVATSKP